VPDQRQRMLLDGGLLPLEGHVEEDLAREEISLHGSALGEDVFTFQTSREIS